MDLWLHYQPEIYYPLNHSRAPANLEAWWRRVQLEDMVVSSFMSNQLDDHGAATDAYEAAYLRMELSSAC
jgi:hypothetical protein